MRIVAVSQRVDHFPELNETRDALDQRLPTFITSAGGLSVPVPNALGDGIKEWLSVLQPGAVVLSGGNDLGQCLARDATEYHLLDYARDQRLPVLGICRGMQMIAHWAGCSLHSVAGHVRTRHQLSGVVNTEVNSYHSFALAECPVDFDVLACSEDGAIEAIRHTTMPWEGWMWHPEREAAFSSHDIERLKGLLK